MRTAIVAGIASLASVLSTPLAGYIQNQRFPSGVPMVRTDFTAIPYSLDSRAVAGARNTTGEYTILPGSDPGGAVRAAAQTWNDVSSSEIHFLPVETSTGIEPTNDGLNVITFADTPSTRTLVGDAVAVTYLFTRNGALTDTDILFNPRLRFSTDLDPTAFDIQGTLTHELGHALGLDHSGVVGATMFATTTRGSNRIARLSEDDIAFARDVYPGADVAGSFGQIQGQVRHSFGTTVTGAHVVAVDSQQSIVIGAITGTDGSYRLGRLPPGHYKLYAEPLDGPADSAQLGPTRRTTEFFRTTFLGGATNPQQVDVGAGAVASVDLVVEDGDRALNIEGAGAAPEGSLILSRLVAEMQAGGVFQMELFGEGLDLAEITESSISFPGTDLHVVEGSLERDTIRFSDGSSFPELAFEVEAPAGIPSGLQTVMVSAASQVSVLTGGVAIIDPLPSPAFTSDGVTNAASFLSGPVAAGEIVTVFGENLGAEQALLGGLDESGMLVRNLGGVTVTFSGLPAPLFFVSRGQLNLQVPYELAGITSATLLIRRGQAASAPVTVAVAPARPGLFALPSSAAAIVANQDGSLNNASNAAERGSVVSLYGTGQGVTNPPLGSGELAASSEPLNRLRAAVSVTIGGREAQVLFAGMAPGFVGLLQVNAVVPGGASTGPQTPVELTIDGVPTGQDAVMAVK